MVLITVDAETVAPRRTEYVRLALSRSHAEVHDTRIEWGETAASVGVVAEPPWGPSLFGAIDLTANRASPYWALLLTVGNSPPNTSYWLLPSMVQAACDWPV